MQLPFITFFLAQTCNKREEGGEDEGEMCLQVAWCTCSSACTSRREMWSGARGLLQRRRGEAAGRRERWRDGGMEAVLDGCSPPHTTTTTSTAPPRMVAGRTGVRGRSRRRSAAAAGSRFLCRSSFLLRPFSSFPPLRRPIWGGFFWGSSNNKPRCVRVTERELGSGAGPLLVLRFE